MKAEEGQGAIGRYSWTCVKLLKLPLGRYSGAQQILQTVHKELKGEE